MKVEGETVKVSTWDGGHAEEFANELLEGAEAHYNYITYYPAEVPPQPTSAP